MLESNENNQSRNTFRIWLGSLAGFEIQLRTHNLLSTQWMQIAGNKIPKGNVT